jgi:LacI family transcriptional regulator
VILISPVPLHQAPQQVIYWVDELREYLRKVGFTLEFLARPSCYHQQPETFLKELSNRHHPVAWVLYRSTAKMQKWFSEHKLPCVIAGSQHIELELVSVDIDYRALCLHAAGLLLARGYEIIYLMIPSSGLAGDIESERGFLEGAEKFGKGTGKSVVLRHNGTLEGVVNCLEKIFPSRATIGLLVANQYHSLTALCWLMQNKLRVPSDVGIISRDNDVFYDYVTQK